MTCSALLLKLKKQDKREEKTTREFGRINEELLKN
jgi:hypothetical protein